jgi:hypothetical protein
MNEPFVGLGVWALSLVMENPEKFGLKSLGWKLVVENESFEMTSLKKGKIARVFVRAMTASGKIITWDQPVYFENPGSASLPIRKLTSGQIIVYLLITQRSIVEPRVNVETVYDLSRTWLEIFGPVAQLGMASFECPRGIGDGSKKILIEPSAMWRAERTLHLISCPEAFDQAGGSQEFQEEVPQFRMFGPPKYVGPYNGNTALIATNPGLYVVPICPDVTAALEPVSTATQQVEMISGVIPFVFPHETDQLIRQTREITSSGVWNPQNPVLLDGFTLSLLSHLSELDRSGKIPVTG